MKLRNKKTGEIVEATDFNIMSDYNSLADLNADWEDCKEPKMYWYIYGSHIFSNPECGDTLERMFKATGNYFKTKEAAEKAVEKLKAFKRLKDKGFRFVGVREIGKVIDFDMPKSYHCAAFNKSEALKFYKDLMLLFGGEDE